MLKDWYQQDTSGSIAGPSLAHNKAGPVASKGPA